MKLMSPYRSVFVVQKLSMIEIGRLDVGGCAVGNGPDVGGERFGIVPLLVRSRRQRLIQVPIELHSQLRYSLFIRCMLISP